MNTSLHEDKVDTRADIVQGAAFTSLICPPPKLEHILIGLAQLDFYSRAESIRYRTTGTLESLF